jgi:hypothetical protein
MCSQTMHSKLCIAGGLRPRNSCSRFGMESILEESTYALSIFGYRLCAVCAGEMEKFLAVGQV